MKKLTIAASVLSLPMASAWAEPEVYGKANVSLEHVDAADETGVVLRSNASRLGFKGKESVNDSLELIYKLEYEVYIDDKDTFKQRDIFVGVRGNLGTLFAGRMDTPLKDAQDKIDLFNDLRGDIKYMITSHDNRESNTVMYATPDSLGGFGAQFAYITNEQDNDMPGEDAVGKSAAVTYNAGGFYAAVAMDQDVEDEGTDAARFVSLYKLDSWQFGALYEESEAADADSESGWLVSGQYKFGQWALKTQFGESDIKELGGETVSVGLDYKLTSNATLYSFYTEEQSDVTDKDQYVGAGVVLRF